MIWVGTSGYNYPEWKGSFYPSDLPAAKMLPYYAARFPTVEINYTFYRMPNEKLVSGWAAQTPSPYKLTLKAPRRITHDSRLRDCGDLVRAFCEVAATLGQAREELEHARRRPATGARHRREIFFHRERLPDVALLRNPTQSGGCTLVRAQGRDGAPVEVDAAAAIARDADQRREKRRLAGPVATEQRERLAFVERQVDAVDDHALSVARPQAAYAKKLSH